MKFISRVVTMGEDRFLIPFPKEHIKSARSLKGKYIRVSVQEIPVE
jgi:hypothetical protein